MISFLQTMTAAAVLPQAMAAETMARCGAFWAAGATRALRAGAPARGGAVPALPAPVAARITDRTGGAGGAADTDRSGSAQPGSAVETFDPTAGPVGPLPA